MRRRLRSIAIAAALAAVAAAGAIAATASGTVVRRTGECGTPAGCEVTVRPPGTWRVLQDAAGPSLRLPYPRRTGGLRLATATFRSDPEVTDDGGDNVCAGYEEIRAVYRGGGARVGYDWYLARNGDCGDLGGEGARSVRSVRLGSFRADLYVGPGASRTLAWGQDGYTGHLLTFRGITTEQALAIARSVR